VENTLVHRALLPAMPSQFLKLLGDRVRQRRIGLGISQEAFANKCGVHRTYIGKVERGEQNVSMASLERIAKGLGVRVSQLVREAEEAA
jgi:transcriptional regulator with XRE-family HTH domain